MIGAAVVVAARAGAPEDALARWLDAQAQLTSWSADFVQTRHLQALTQPLSSPGKVWFAAPGQFRWEVGQPALSIAIREDDQLVVLAPNLKRAERYSLSAAARGPMKEALALLDTGFPRDSDDFRRRFDLLAFSSTNATWTFQLQPRSASARKLLPGMTLVVETNDFTLSATELRFADGSRLRNDFKNSVKNPPVDPSLFHVVLDDSWKVTTPMAK